MQKKKSILVFTNQIMDKNNTAYRYLLVLLNTSLEIRALLSETFLKNTNILSMNLNF